MKEILASTVLGVFETLRHHPGILQVPEVDIFGVVPANEKVQQTIPVVIEPDGGVCIDPLWQTGRLCHAGETMSAIIVEEFGPSPFVKKKVLEPVVVVIAPDSPHRDAGLRMVKVRNRHLRRDIFKSAIVHVPKQAIL